MTWNHENDTSEFTISDNESTVGDTSLRIGATNTTGQLIWNASLSASPTEVRIITDFHATGARGGFLVVGRFQDDDNYIFAGLNASEEFIIQWILGEVVDGTRTIHSAQSMQNWDPDNGPGGDGRGNWFSIRISIWNDQMGDTRGRIEFWDANAQEFQDTIPIHGATLSDRVAELTIQDGGGMGIGTEGVGWSSSTHSHLDATELLWP